MTLIALLQRDRPDSSNPIGWLLFQAGLFLLPSSAFLAGVFLLPAVVFGTRDRAESYFKDLWNIPFFAAGILMLIGCIHAFSGWLAWVGLANWLPFFWCFWCFQPYLFTTESRRRSSLCLLSGSIPVLITGFGQLWLGWEGPWQLFNGLIIWFVAAGGEPVGRLSGLFDYANIAGAWLSMVWPFCLAAFLQPSLNYRRRGFIFLLTISFVAALVLTDSRNAWGALLLALPFVLGPTSWTWLVPLLVLFLLPIALAVLPGVNTDIQNIARKFVPEGLWARLNDMRYIQERSLASTRLSQWKIALQFIAERPLLGWGAAAFSVLYPLRTGQWHGHAHNLPLEISVAHGWPAATLFVGTVIALLITAVQRGVLTRNINTFDRAWWVSIFILVILHASDMPFFDSRLNIAGWILLAGLRCLIVPSSLSSAKD